MSSRPGPVASTCLAISLMAAPVVPGQDGAGTLDAAIDKVAPGAPKWAVVCVVKNGAKGAPEFQWHEYRDSAGKSDFWPASAIKLYAVIGAMERVNEAGLDLDTSVTFEHQDKEGRWVLDAARTLREMLSEVFRRSSNEDYTLLLRLAGVDWINTHLLVKARGFPGSALMRGYVKDRPWAYVREERQRARLVSQDGARSAVIEHGWSGRLYAQERGCTVLDARTGNVTTPRELADCLRRIIFHEHLPEAERFRLTDEQVRFLREGDAGFAGMNALTPESGPSAWKGTSWVFPKARCLHKSGVISNYALDVAYVDASANGGPRFILVPVIAAGGATKPVDGETLVSQMALEIARWVRRQSE